jgi:hypothetical protein
MNTIIPEDINAVTDEELATLENDLVAEFDSLVDAGSNDVATLTQIAEAVEAVRAEKTARVEAAVEAEKALAALAERVRGTEEADEADAVVAEETETTEEVVEDNTTPEVAETEATEQESDLVTASASNTPKAPSARAVARRSTTPEVAEAQPEVVITAAADVPGFAGGASIDTIGLARALHAKARTLSNGSGFVPVASINLPIQHKLGADLAYNLDVIERATAPEALTAAGWCAPSENLYTLFGVDSGDGLLDLPTVQVTRGGLNIPGFIGIGEASDALWSWTEADTEDPEATKPCLYIPCPTFEDYRLQAAGLCLTNGNLTDRAFPELTARFIALAINAHLHRLSGLMVAEISGSATGVTMGAVPTSAAGSILHALDVQVADYRSQYRMSVNAVLEAVFPLWAREAIRADLAMRTGVDLVNVSDEMVDDYFRTRKVRPQFVHDYQPLYTTGPAKTAFPTSVDFLLYPAGGYIKGDGGTIDLGVVRDSVLNATNDYTAAWTEQLWLVGQTGPAAREVTVNYGVNGVTGCCPAPEAG